MLANVRNGVGFAGCDTGDGFTPISEPRGLPEDVTAEVKEASDRWGVDGHSHSWVILAELLAYDWQGQRTKLRGWVSGSDFRLWKESGAAWPGRRGPYPKSRSCRLLSSPALARPRISTPIRELCCHIPLVLHLEGGGQSNSVA